MGHPKVGLFSLVTITPPCPDLFLSPLSKEEKTVTLLRSDPCFHHLKSRLLWGFRSKHLKLRYNLDRSFPQACKVESLPGLRNLATKLFPGQTCTKRSRRRVMPRQNWLLIYSSPAKGKKSLSDNKVISCCPLVTASPLHWACAAILATCHARKCIGMI